MEKTNYIDKAKKLMLQTARTTALVIVPLAAAVSAHANTIVPALPTGGFACSPNCSGGDSTITNPNGLTGVSFYGTADFYTSGGSFGFGFSAGGPFAGTLPSPMPVSWDFELTSDPSVTIGSWSLTFTLSGFAAGSVTETGSGGGTFIGSDSFAVSPTVVTSGSLTETVTLSTNTSGNGSVYLSVPPGTSFDFNSVSTPEPGSAGLMAAGLALLAGWARKRR
jgi:hypothetical protein